MKNKQLLAVAIATAMTAQAFAEEEANSSETEVKEQSELEMVKVVGQATGGLNNLISKDQLENAQVTDLTDIFALNPEVSAGGGVSLGQKIYVRNAGEDMINVTVDGASQSGGVFHHAGRVVIEPDLLKQVEVEAGAGSATAGIGALGGAVRFVTKDPEDLLRGNENVGATIKSTYYSNGESLKHSATVYGAEEKGNFSGMVNIVSADFKDREDGAGNTIVGSESENTVGFVKLVSKISDQQKLSLSYETLNQEGDILYRPEWLPVNNDISETEANRNTFIANYNFKQSDLLNLSINAYQTMVEQLRSDPSIPVGESQDGSVETRGLTVENTSLVGINKLIYGINYREDEAQLNTFDDPDDDGFYQVPSSHKEDSEVLAFYVQDIISVTDALTVTTGLRFDDFTLNDVNGLKITDSGVSPNLSANYAITPEVSISAGYAEALRGATVNDAYVVYEGYKTNDPDLEAEKAKNFEIGADYNAGPISAGVGVYQSTIENQIGKPYPYNWSNDIVNNDDIETQGYYLKAAYKQDGLMATAAFHSAETEQNNIPVERYVHGSTATSIGDTLLVDVSYQLLPEVNIGWVAQVVSDLDPVTYDLIYVHPVAGELEFPTTSAKKEGYSTHDLYVNWSPMIDDTLVVNLAVKNVFDENYLNHASIADYTGNTDFESVSGQNDPGRDIRLSVAVKF